MAKRIPSSVNHDHVKCPMCSYSLLGLPREIKQCPECGTEIGGCVVVFNRNSALYVVDVVLHVLVVICLLIMKLYVGIPWTQMGLLFCVILFISMGAYFSSKKMIVLSQYGIRIIRPFDRTTLVKWAVVGQVQLDKSRSYIKVLSKHGEELININAGFFSDRKDWKEFCLVTQELLSNYEEENFRNGERN